MRTEQQIDRADQRTYLARIRTLGIEALPRMYLPREKCFAFTLRRTGSQALPEGLSPRYTSIVLLGLVDEASDVRSTALAGDDAFDICRRNAERVVAGDNLGDVALCLWAANAIGLGDMPRLRERLKEIYGALDAAPAVQLSWVVSAAVSDTQLSDSDFVHRAAERLLAGYNPASGVFSHVIGNSNRGLRGHVSCFADFVYPIQALSQYHAKFNKPAAYEAALACAARACRMQGPEGQWWWHFDWRTGDVVEKYPVYSVHQHGMGPMALFELAAAHGSLHGDAIRRSLEWLERSPEISGSLVDDQARLIWRKVARREPAKLARKLQAAASRVNASLRVPGVNLFLPPGAIDFEWRPYEIGWLLYAWPPGRVATWGT